MFLGLAITGIVSLIVSSSDLLLKYTLQNQTVIFVLLVAEIFLVMILAHSVRFIHSTKAGFLFIFYSAINGITLASIFLIYTKESIASTFFVTSAMFGFSSVYGYFTKKDLSSLASLLVMGLFGLILASITNIIFYNDTAYWITTYAGVLIFTVFTAYDVQYIKKMNVIGNEDSDEDRTEAIVGALALYLDFVNLFLYLLRLFGKKK